VETSFPPLAGVLDPTWAWVRRSLWAWPGTWIHLGIHIICTWIFGAYDAYIRSRLSISNSTTSHTYPFVHRARWKWWRLIVKVVFFENIQNNKALFVSFYFEELESYYWNRLFFRMWHSTTFQSYHIRLSQIHGVRDGNWFYRFTCYFSDVQLIAHSSTCFVITWM
jgi:hypothetical protein